MRTSSFLLCLVAVTLALVFVSGTSSPSSVSSRLERVLGRGGDTTVRVRGNTVDESLGENGSEGWWFNRDASTSTPYQFNFEDFSIGYGSLEVLPIGATPTDKLIAELFMFDDLNTLAVSVDYNLVTASSTASQVYVNVYANRPGSAADNYYDCRFDFVADGTDTLGIWKTLAFGQYTVANRVVTRANNLAGCPSSKQMADMPSGSQVRAIAINFGDTSTSDVGDSVRFDKVIVGATTYDFEVAPQVKDDCKNGGYVQYSFENQGACISSLQANANN